MAAAEQHRRLLMLAPVVPADRGNGLAMRAGFFLDAYSRRFDVDLAVVPVAAGAADMTRFVRSRTRRAEVLMPAGGETHYALVSALKDPAARVEAFRRYGRPSLAGLVGREPHRALEAWTRGIRYDAVHVSRLYLAELASTWLEDRETRPRVVMDCDEDDAEAYRRFAAMESRCGNRFAAEWADAERIAFARFAAHWLPQFDLLFAASANEAKSLSTKSLSARGGRVVAIPNVVPTANSRARSRRRPPGRTVIFVGSLGYAPNAEAVRWFVARVWPQLQRALPPPIRLVIVGSNPPPAIARLARHSIVVTGAVPDVAPFYRDADLAVIPIRAGGGTRIKLIEAAAFGVPIVSTPFGAEGTTFRHGSELLLASTEAAFRRSCLALLQDRDLAARLAAQARRKARRDYDAGRWTLRVAQLVAGRAVPNVADEEIGARDGNASGQS